ncbi:MAG: JDVT-CTERM system glutamic-type intramembrane protease [Gallionella sp.]
MLRPDSRLFIAVIAPLLIWPWVPAWDGGSYRDGVSEAIVLIVLAPIAEEIVFRGFVQGGLLRIARFRQIALGISIANWTTSIVFAAAHGWQHPLTFLPGYLVVSVVLGYFRERYNGIRIPVLLHGYYNLGLWFFAS